MYFVMRYLGRPEGAPVLDGFVQETLEGAKHQFHQVMTTYAYGANENYNYVMCEIKSTSGRSLMIEVDDRTQPTPSTPEVVPVIEE